MKEKKFYNFTKLRAASRFRESEEIPTTSEIEALIPGNAVLLAFEFKTNDKEVQKLEKLWVKITDRNGASFSGNLIKNPLLIQKLSPKNNIAFQDKHILAVMESPAMVAVAQPFSQFCLIAENILKGKERIGFMFRHKPIAEDDSGWVFFPPYNKTLENEEKGNEVNPIMMPLGHMIAFDPSISPYMDSPIDTGYERPANRKSFRKV